MMPQLLTVRVTRPSGRPIRIWVPVLPLLLILLPVLLLAILAASIACMVYRISAVRALGATWRALCALPGTMVDLTHGNTAVLVSIR